MASDQTQQFPIAYISLRQKTSMKNKSRPNNILAFILYISVSIYSTTKHLINSQKAPVLRFIPRVSSIAKKYN